ncbi:MAG: LysM peptidoglycan-binding domain-containing M23 family metallopeptidase [Candidatus Omnitrophica bacterium]|nr:LysM peptidoglycan-binding domain-containing M23 family metallopeptidase [Candidatus Omnitrophota bacterium]MCM8790300.1 LysM peptidoglycan-binding domain-containing M23 family metallopeptidase [Candidatus Omnitrophota bacterium]
MRTIISIVMILFLGGCTTTSRSHNYASYSAPCGMSSYPQEYDVVRLAPAAGGLQPIAQQSMRHIVKPGETLWSISKAYNVDIDELARINSIKNTGVIEKGQILTIPSRPSAVSSKQVTKKRNYTAARSGSFMWPVRGTVVSRFGSKVDKGINKGIDIRAREGTNVMASKSGKVVYRDSQFKGFGQTVIIDHMDGYQTVYSYNSEILVNVGDVVNQRDVIARVGSSGRATEPMLHFEIRRNGEPQNPEFYLTR